MADDFWTMLGPETGPTGAAEEPSGPVDPVAAPGLCTDVRKTQAIRAWDVVAIGPMMVAAGLWTGPLPALARLALVGSGVGTVLYNARNWIMTRNANRAAYDSRRKTKR